MSFALTFGLSFGLASGPFSSSALGPALGPALGLIGPIGTPELLIILFVALLMFGGRLPDVARSLGKSLNQFKRGLKDVDDEMSRPDPPPLPKSLPPAPPAPPASD